MPEPEPVPVPVPDSSAPPLNASPSGRLRPSCWGASGGGAIERLRGAAVLAAMALLGYGLSSLARVGAQRVESAAWLSAEGEEIILVKEDGVQPWPFLPRSHLVIARSPVELDARRSVLRLGAKERCLPPGWPTVLVNRTGEVSQRPSSIDPSTPELIERLRPLPFETVRSVLCRLDPGLESAFKD